MSKELAMSSELQNEIDTIVLKPFGQNSNDILKKMREKLRVLLSERGIIF